MLFAKLVQLIAALTSQWLNDPGQFIQIYITASQNNRHPLTLKLLGLIHYRRERHSAGRFHNDFKSRPDQTHGFDYALFGAEQNLIHSLTHHLKVAHPHCGAQAIGNGVGTVLSKSFASLEAKPGIFGLLWFCAYYLSITQGCDCNASAAN
jgi:hypothetical protein